MGPASTLTIGSQNILERADDPAATLCDHGFNDCCDLEKVQSAVQERLHGNLVGGIQHGRRQSTSPCRRLRQRETTKLVEVRRAEVEARRSDEIQEFYTGGDSIGPRQGVGDRGPHVGRSQLRKHGAIEVFDSGMHDALGMDDNLDLLGQHAEQQAGLDELQSLVHEGRGIHGNLASHHPVGMSDRLLGSRGGDGLAGPVTEWPPGSGQENAPYTGRLRSDTRVMWHALEDGVVLAVDRQQHRTASTHRLHEQRGQPSRATPCSPAADACPRARRRRAWSAGRLRRQSRPSRCEPQASRQFGQSALARQDPCLGRGVSEESLELAGRRLVGKRGIRGTITRDLLGELRSAAVRSNGNEFESIGMARDDIEGALANGAGRAQYRYADHATTPNIMSPKNSTGAAPVTLSIRSITPP